MKYLLGSFNPWLAAADIMHLVRIPFIFEEVLLLVPMAIVQEYAALMIDAF